MTISSFSYASVPKANFVLNNKTVIVYTKRNTTQKQTAEFLAEYIK